MTNSLNPVSGPMFCQACKGYQQLNDKNCHWQIKSKHWRSSHYSNTHVWFKNSDIQGRSYTKCGKSDFPKYKELLLKERIRFLWEQIVSFKRSSHFDCLIQLSPFDVRNLFSVLATPFINMGSPIPNYVSNNSQVST